MVTGITPAKKEVGGTFLSSVATGTVPFPGYSTGSQGVPGIMPCRTHEYFVLLISAICRNIQNLILYYG
jgi:hypothetical protein